MRTVYLSLAAAFSGGAAVWIAFWLFESIVPVFIPFEVSTVATLVALLLAGALLARRFRLVEAAALLAGSGASWALHELRPLAICQSELLYRPCASSEIASMALPAVVLLIAGAALGASAVAGTRSPR